MIRNINITSNPTSSLPRILIRNGSLRYGLYKFAFNFTIITNDETAPPYTSVIIDYIRIIPTGFIISGFEIGFAELPQSTLTVNPIDTVALIPAFFSYDVDFLTDSKTLDYLFFCKLVDVDQQIDLNTNHSNNFTNDIYRIFPNVPLTKEQLEAEDTCFKQEGKYFIINIIFK